MSLFAAERNAHGRLRALARRCANEELCLTHELEHEQRELERLEQAARVLALLGSGPGAVLLTQLLVQQQLVDQLGLELAHLRLDLQGLHAELHDDPTLLRTPA
jgi:hypothetical protein